MGSTRVILLALVWKGLSTMAQPGYITLEGDLFRDEYGDSFYPMVMNYYVDYAYPTGSPPPAAPDDPADLANCYLFQTSLIGLTGPFNYLPGQTIADGEVRILQDLREIHNMGFNTVRLIMTPLKREAPGFKLEVKHFPSGQDPYKVDLNYPYDPATNFVAAFHFDNILRVCSLAQEADLKVLLICADGSELINGDVSSQPVEEYADYLSALAGYFHGQEVHNLLAYEFFGEPSYAEPRIDQRHTKAQICEIAALWHDVVKGADPDHLTTIGCVFNDDVLQSGWDPNLLKVDFTNVHLYPPRPVEWDDPDHITASTERYVNMLYVHHHEIKRPYIIAETSFPAIDPPPGSTNWTWPHSVYGDEADQRDFVEATFPVIWNSRASGYGWWDFQDKHWYSGGFLDEPDLTYALSAYAEDYMGLLGWGNPTADPYAGYAALRKDAVQSFIDWAIAPPPIATPTWGPASATVDMADRFYNAYLNPPNSTVHTDLGGLLRYGTLTGHMEDQLGDPIPNALVRCASVVGRTSSLGGGFENIYGSSYGYTDSNGDFEIRTYDQLPFNIGNWLDDVTPDPTRDRVVEDLQAGAYSSSWVHRGWSDDGALPESDDTYILNSLRSEFDIVLDGVTVDIGDTEDHQAYASITALDMLIDGDLVDDGGSSELRAREIHLLPGFHARKGCIAHIVADVLDLSCQDIATADLKSTAHSIGHGGWPTKSAGGHEKLIDLVLHHASRSWSFQVIPNPSNGRFLIQIEGFATLNSSLTATLTDRVGRNVRSFRMDEPSRELDLHELGSGVYTLRLSSNTSVQSETIVLL